MKAEIAASEEAAANRGWIFYDTACAFWVRTPQRAGRLFENAG